MAEAALELRTILEAAEQAASAEDFASAEQYLRQAAVLQQTQLGPAHLELANTLNNLGIVCERLGKSADAEASYRRAYAIARAGLPPGDPLVATSEQNLRDFCVATGKPFEVAAPPTPARPVAPPVPAVPATVAVPAKPATPTKPGAPAKPAASSKPATAAKPAAPARPAAAAEHAVPAARTSSPVAPEQRSSLSIWVPVGGVVLLIAAAAWWFSTGDSAEPVATPAAPRVETASPREEPASPAPVPPPPVVTSTPANPGTASAPERPAVAATPARPTATETKARPTAGATALSLVEAKVCRSLSTSDWRCAVATNPAAPGMFIFYTRVKSARDTTVQHRWLMNGKLLRTVNLRVGANQSAGYRTYSRNTVSAELRGNWTIEVRDADGALLHEERVVVQ